LQTVVLDVAGLEDDDGKPLAYTRELGRFCCRTSLRGDANRDSVYLRRPSAERFDDGAAQG